MPTSAHLMELLTMIALALTIGAQGQTETVRYYQPLELE
jgi:hypothetical protein